MIVLEPREVPLGGPRSLTVRRTLPQRERSLIGPWCFVDHYGPDVVTSAGAMTVPPHPHTGLQTVSWLFAGEIEHRDSVGSDTMVRPGELNLMTAGQGIQHSEVSTADTTELHGAQLWIALPEQHRNRAPFFEHFVPETVQLGELTAKVFLGTLGGSASTAKAFSPIVGAQLDLPPDTSVSLPVDPTFEHGVLLDRGTLTVNGDELPLNDLAFLEVGPTSIKLSAGTGGARALLIGGAPFGEKIIMWWNFIGRTHEEIVQFRHDWQLQVIEKTTDSGRYGFVTGHPSDALAAPKMPIVRLKPRD